MNAEETFERLALVIRSCLLPGREAWEYDNMKVEADWDYLDEAYYVSSVRCGTTGELLWPMNGETAE